MLHLSLPSGPSTQYVNNKLLSGAHVKGGRGEGAKIQYFQSLLPGALADGPKPPALPSLENSPGALQAPASRVAAHRCPPTPVCGERAGAATWRAPGDGSCALFPTARGESPAPARPKLGTHSGPGGCKFHSRGSYQSSRSFFLLFLLRLGHRHRRPAAAASASRLRPVPSSSTRELSQRFAPPRRDWPAERAASQWSRLEAASPAALGLPAEPAAAVSRESAGAETPPARPERRGAHAVGSAGARGRGRAGRSELGAPCSERRSRADLAGGGGGQGEGTQQVGLAEQVRLPARATPASRACRQVAWPRMSGSFAAALSPGERERTPREHLSWVLGSFGARRVGGRDEAVPSPPQGAPCCT